jgi:hypothetical protein
MADEKKIIIDEDWKSQVQAEKEAAAKSPAAGEPAGSPADMQMPEASLEMLVTTLVTEAMMSLGQIPHPHTGEPMYHPQQAKYLIDMIDVLREKTKGNVTPDESALMENLLHQLRMVYVQLTTGQRPGAIETP